MLLREIKPEEKDSYNSVVSHPMQSWEWGEFKKEAGTKVERWGFFENGKLKKALQVTFHKLPYINYQAGYFPKGYMPDKEQLAALKQLGEKNNAIFIKLEPDVAAKADSASGHKLVHDFLTTNDCVPGRHLFGKYTFEIDLNQTEEELFAKLSSKTRYNVRLAYKKGVRILENTSEEGMETFIQILEETSKRDGFYIHTPDYFRKMWQAMKDSGMMHIFHATYENTVIVAWIIFEFNGDLYYPYGSSRSVYKDVMASNLMMWEMIRYGQQQKCKKFDLWGSLGPDPNPKDPWYGFHRFKKGYGGDLMEFLGTYDYVLNKPIYQLFTFVDNLRWKFLRIKTKIGL